MQYSGSRSYLRLPLQHRSFCQQRALKVKQAT